MAYQARGRGPLLDSATQAAVEKRGKELIGIALIAVAIVLAATILSYSPTDPSWISVTDAPVENLLGRLGASIAAPLFIIVGWGSFGLPLILGVWGVRFAFHFGEERAQSRIIFAPIMLALASIYASTLAPGAEWIHAFGLGGLFGDTVMGALLTILPIGAQSGVKLMSMLAGVVFVLSCAFVLGFTRNELGNIARRFMIGLVLTYDGIMRLLGHSASGAVQAAKTAQARRMERRDEAQAHYEAEQAAWEETVVDEVAEPYEPVVEERPKPRLRMPGLIKRADAVPESMPEPELVENVFSDDWDVKPEEERISAKIADVMRTRAREGATIAPPELHQDKPLTKGRGRGPDPLVLDDDTPEHHVPLQAEPPLTATPILTRTEPPLSAPVTAAVAAHVATPQTMDVAPVDEPAHFEAAPIAEPVTHQPRMAPIPTAEPKKVVQPRVIKSVQPSTRAKAEAQPSLAFEETQSEYELPPLGLLESPIEIQRHHLSDDALEENARMLESVLDDYGVKGEIVS
ncbi:DNA translocase FtsK 4TM domain-containing protein, partial [uncultured Shimia sp.]|uniref:DNA translocase FtsK 4TM domain-containing protein n=1 Tax=uncultured Shimia sp. TaxID=573152 RepID=UPI0025FE7FD8